MPEVVSVSVITPCYNGARFLESTLRSAVRQTRPPVEILVVDDGSTDDSARIAESFGGPVRVIRQSNQGESVARNRALSEARGSHVLFLDADDLLEPTSIEQLAGALDSRSGAVGLMGCAWFVDDPDAPYATQLHEASSFYPSIIESNLAPPHCWLTPRALVERAGGFNAGMHWFEDWDLWWRVGLLDPELVRVPHVGALYRRHPGSQLAVTRMVDRARGHVTLMTRMAEAFLGRPDMLEQHGYLLFWSCFTALDRARSCGVSWAELGALSGVLRELAVRGPRTLQSTKLARAMRVMGVRPSATLHKLLTSA